MHNQGVVVLWLLGILLIAIPAQDYWHTWKMGESYRRLKRDHALDPLVGVILKNTAHHFQIRPAHIGFPAVGLVILICETIDAIH